MLLSTRTGGQLEFHPECLVRQWSEKAAAVPQSGLGALHDYRCTVQAVKSEFLELGKAAAAVAEQGERELTTRLTVASLRLTLRHAQARWSGSGLIEMAFLECSSPHRSTSERGKLSSL